MRSEDDAPVKIHVGRHAVMMRETNHHKHGGIPLTTDVDQFSYEEKQGRETPFNDCTEDDGETWLFKQDAQGDQPTVDRCKERCSRLSVCSGFSYNKELTDDIGGCYFVTKPILDDCDKESSADM